jgi:3-hydroxybutyryl-CoA dehydrogenase
VEVKRIAVVGAGTMGSGIAGQAAISGFEVILNDLDDERIGRGFDVIDQTWSKGLHRGKVSQGDVNAARARLLSTTDIAGAVRDVDLVIEAVPEKIELKQKLFGIFEESARGDAILATNTSSLSIGDIASMLSDPSRAVGMHFFNPVAASKLVELVRCEATTSDVIETVRGVSEALGKECIVVRDSPGFATSRLGITLGNEAMRMFQEGVASAADIDKAMVLGYKHPIGPLALTDLVGLDVRLAITEHLFEQFGTDTFDAPRILREMVAAGKLGRKTGEGFYVYD